MTHVMGQASGHNLEGCDRVGEVALLGSCSVVLKVWPSETTFKKYAV